MRRLILEAPPGPGLLWLTEAPRALALPAGGGFALHLARAAPGAVLHARAAAGVARLAPGFATGWIEPGLAAAADLVLQAEGGPLALSRAADGEPARRVFAEAPGAIPEAQWRAARVWGAGAVVALGAGRARPVLRLAAGAAAWVTLPPLDLPALPAPRLVALRGPLPRAALRWGLPHAPAAAGPAPLTLALRAGLACEVVWEG